VTKPSPDAGKSRREQLRERLIAVAERSIAEGGLSALRARDVATQANCALGAIYTAFADLDELVLCVNARTLARLEAALTSPARDGGELLRLARAYVNYARDEGPRWRALFEHRMPGKPLPEWYAQELDHLFSLLEAPLSRLLPGAPKEELHARARTLFSAVHGIVLIGVEEKLAPTSAKALDAALEEFIATVERGLR